MTQCMKSHVIFSSYKSVTPMTATLTKKFEIPLEILQEYTVITLNRYVHEAKNLAKEARDFFNAPKPQFEDRWAEYGYYEQWRKYERNSFLNCKFEITPIKDTYPVKATKTFKGVSLRTEAICEAAKATVEKARIQFEGKMNKYLEEDEHFYKANFRLNGNRIEGTAYGKNDSLTEAFYVQAKLIWNYRYGSNSANGVLTQYTQFRGSRH